MTEKEKAKAYDEAIERAKKLRDKIDNKIMEEIFPELKESDDEKIKNAILNYLKKIWENCQDDICGVDIEDAIAWLEKQGEQTLSQTNERAWLYPVAEVLTWQDGIGQYLDDSRVQEFAKRLCSKYVQKLYNHSNTEKNKQKSTDKIKPKFNVGDWVVFITSESVYQVEKKENYEYTLKHIFGGSLCLSFFDENFIREWTIQDAKDGDVLVSKHNQPFIYNGNYNDYEVGAYCGIECTGKQFLITCSEIHWTFNEFIKPATKEQHDALMKAMNDAGYKWDAEKKELKKRK